jgi:hypothetical protein
MAEMSDPKPLACSLGASDLRQRLDEIAELGSAGLIGYENEGGTHTLRFRPSPETSRRLEVIVAAEAKCCSFLDLELSERDGELVLTLAAPDRGQFVADQLAVAFGASSPAAARSPSAGPRRCPRRS